MNRCQLSNLVPPAIFATKEHASILVTLKNARNTLSQTSGWQKNMAETAQTRSSS